MHNLLKERFLLTIAHGPNISKFLKLYGGVDIDVTTRCLSGEGNFLEKDISKVQMCLIILTDYVWLDTCNCSTTYSVSLEFDLQSSIPVPYFTPHYYIYITHV